MHSTQVRALIGVLDDEPDIQIKARIGHRMFYNLWFDEVAARAEAPEEYAMMLEGTIYEEIELWTQT